MTTTTHEDRSLTLQVAPVVVAFEGVQLPDGRVMSIELAEPRRRWAIFATTVKGVEIIGMTDSQDEAVDHAEYVRRRLEGADGPILVASNDEIGRLQ